MAYEKSTKMIFDHQTDVDENVYGMLNIHGNTSEQSC